MSYSVATEDDLQKIAQKLLKSELKSLRTEKLRIKKLLNQYENAVKELTEQTHEAVKSASIDRTRYKASLDKVLIRLNQLEDTNGS